MLIAKPRWNKSTIANRKRNVIILACLASSWMHPAFSADSSTSDAVPAKKRASSWQLAPIATNWGGSIGYDIIQRSNSSSNPVTQQRIILNLKGKGITYISKPWIALVKGTIDFTAYKMRIADSSSSNNNIGGDIGLYLLPYSRFPFDAILSKRESFSGPGFGSLGSQTTRLDLAQRYAPRNKKERYSLTGYRAETVSTAEYSYSSYGYAIAFDTTRLRKQTLSINGTRDYSTRYIDDSKLQFSHFKVDHRFVPTKEISVTSYGSLTSRREYQQGTDSNRNRELNSTVIYRPQAPYYAIGSARLNVYDAGGGSQKRLANGNLGFSYKASQHIRLYASANANAYKSDTETKQTLSTTQTVSAGYPLASFSLVGWRYSSRISGSIINSTRNSTVTTSTDSSTESSSRQSVSVSPSHGVSRGFPLNGGMFSLSLSQSVSLSESTNSQATGSLGHSAAIGWRRSQGTSNTSINLSGRDSRSLKNTQNSTQFVHLSANITETINRDSKLTGTLAIQSTRSTNVDSTTSLNSTNSNASLTYNHLRAFGIRRLIFSSNLSAFSSAPLPVMQAPPSDQGPIAWDNTLSYTIGKLTSSLKVSLYKQGDGKTSSYIWFSLKRYF